MTNLMEQIMFRGFQDSWNHVMNSLQENKLYWDLMDNKEVTEEIIEKLDKELRLVQQENQNLKEDTGDIEALNEESSKVLGDIKGMVINVKSRWQIGVIILW